VRRRYKGRRGYSNWLSPIFLVVGIVTFILVLLTLGTSWSVNWSNMSPTIISILPWLVAFSVALYVIRYMTKR